jgi:PPOX class probable F420-dependent enzyme
MAGMGIEPTCMLEEARTGVENGRVPAAASPFMCREGMLAEHRWLNPHVTTIPDSHRDLLETDTAVLATVGADGRPQLSAVWFLADGDLIRVSLNDSRQKVKNLRANPAVNLFILDRSTPSRYVEIRGDAEVTDDPDYAFADRVGQKYGADLRAFDGENAHRVVVTLRPVRVNAVDMAAD